MSMRSNVVPLLVLAAAAGALLGSCGGGNPAAPIPTPAPTATQAPTPIPTPTDCILPHDGNPGCVPACSFGPGVGEDNSVCDLNHKADPLLFDAVKSAVLQTEDEHPELITHDGAIVHLSPENYRPFFRIVIQKLNATAGICAGDNGLEIAIKDTNDYSEQYKPWTTPNGGTLRTDYTMKIATCAPAWF